MTVYLQLIALATVAAGFYKLLIYPIFVSPLAKIPSAHWSCHFSPAWLLWMKWTSRENREVYKVHMEKGAAVRIGPNLVSINCVDDGVKSIYQGAFPKPEFYWHGFAVYGKPNLFTIKDNTVHSKQKRILSNLFSKSTILASESARASIRDVLYRRALPLLNKASLESKPIEIIEFNYSYFLDTFVQWQFGRSLRSNLVENQKERRMYLDGFFGPAGFTFWQYNFPNFANTLRNFGIFLIPKWVDHGFSAVENWNLEKCDRAKQLLASGEPLAAEDYPAVFEQAMRNRSDIQAKATSYPQRLEIASDMFSLNSGAFETSGNTTTYIFYEMSRNPQWQTRLRQELLTMDNPPLYHPDHIKLDIDGITNPRDLENLPILHAIVMETLRLWPSVPGGQPRVVPKTCSLGGYADIPVGTIVQSYAQVLHHTPEVFSDPWSWKPERWLDADKESLALMKRWFWGFGSGSRGCIGSHFAFNSIKFLVAGVYTNFTTEVHGCGDMEQTDGYLACPKGQRLELTFHAVKSEEDV